MSSEVLLVGHVRMVVYVETTHTPRCVRAKKSPFVPVHGSIGMLFNRHCSHDPALMSVGVCGNLIGDFMFSVVGP